MSFPATRAESVTTTTHTSSDRPSFAGGLTVTDHQTQLERQRAKRRQRHDVEVEVRPLARYDALIPA